MTFQQIRYILEVHRTGSVAAAAKALYLVPASLSIAISNLEQELGCRIFERTRSGIYSSYCQILKTNQEEHTEIRILGTDFAPTGAAFVRLVRTYKDRTDLNFFKAFGPYKSLHKKIVAGEADLLVLMHNESSLPTIEANAETNGLAVKVLKKLPLAAVIGPGHRLYGKETIDFQELADDRIVNISRSSDFNNQLVQKKLLLPPERILSVSSSQVQQQLVDEGLAYSIGAEFPTEETKSRGLRFIPLGDLHQVLVAVYNPAVPMLPEVQRYLLFLQEELDK